MRLHKSKDDVLLTGLLGGIGEYFGIDPTLIRIGFALLAFAGAFPMIPLYIVGAIIVPDADSGQTTTRKKQRKSRKIDKNIVKPHNRDGVSKEKEFDEEDWSDF